jgi:hypothetical protein
VDRGAHHQRHEEAVDEHPLAIHSGEVGRIEIAREARAEVAARILLDARADEMRPDRQAIVMQVAKHPIELRVPIVQIAHIGRLESATLQLESQHDRAGIERHHLVVDVPCIGQELGRQHFLERDL